MPVRSRSRASSVDQELAAVRVDARGARRARRRSPSAMTPPSRTMRRRLGGDRPRRSVAPARVDAEVRAASRCDERRARRRAAACRIAGKPRQRVAQSGEVARPRRCASAMRAAMRSTSTVRRSDVGDARVAPPDRRDAAPRRRRAARAACAWSRSGCVQPVPQQPASRGGRAVVEQRKQRRRAGRRAASSVISRLRRVAASSAG